MQKEAMRIGVAIGIFAMLGLACWYLGFAGEAPKASAAVELGAEMPDFTMKDVNGNEHSLQKYRGKVVVLDFCSHECPWSRGADPHLAALVKEYADKGVVFLGIDSHHKTTTEEIKKYAEEKELTHPILKDVNNEYADKVGAKVTPEIFVIDKEGKLRYHGAFDNRTKPEEKGSEFYTRMAIDAVLAGKVPDPQQVKAWGCTIKRVSK